MTARVKKTALVLIAMVFVLVSCHRRESRSGGNAAPAATTQTIAPADARPATTGTDALTQTVEVEDSRSEADGGTANTPAPAPKPPAPKPTPKKKH